MHNMWKSILIVICLVCVVYGAPQAPPAEDKHEPVKWCAKETAKKFWMRLLFQPNQDKNDYENHIDENVATDRIHFSRFSMNTITKWKIRKNSYFSIKMKRAMHKER